MADVFLRFLYSGSPGLEDPLSNPFFKATGGSAARIMGDCVLVCVVEKDELWGTSRWRTASGSGSTTTASSATLEPSVERIGVGRERRERQVELDWACGDEQPDGHMVCLSQVRPKGKIDHSCAFTLLSDRK